MPSHHPDQKRPAEQKPDQTIAQNVKALQRRVRKMRVVSERSDDKAFMDEAWEESRSNT